MWRRDLPADDHPGEHVDHEREERSALPGAQVGEVPDPQRGPAPVAVKSRLTRSGARCAWGSGIVVRHGFPRRFAPTDAC